MQLSNTRTIPASIETTWNALNDPEFLKDCIAGCEAIERIGDNEYKLLMAAKVGPVSARFTGRMQLSDLDPPKAYSLNFEGNGGAAGFAKGRAHVLLEPDQDAAATKMSYDVQAQVGGKLAQVGSRLIEGAARKVAEDFFAAFTGKLAVQNVAPAPGAAVVLATEARQGGAGHPRWLTWVIVAIAAAALLAWFLSKQA